MVEQNFHITFFVRYLKLYNILIWKLLNYDKLRIYNNNYVHTLLIFIYPANMLIDKRL